MKINKTIKNCRIDNSKLYSSLNLGNIYISDFTSKRLSNEELKHNQISSNLKLVYSKKSELVQLDTTIDQKKLYKNYWYFSGTNKTMQDQLYDIYKNCSDLVRLSKNDIVLDIGCNDGTLLSYFKKDAKTFGIDPAENISKYAKKIVDYHCCDFFSKNSYFSKVKKKAKIITSIAMFYDLDEPNKFVKNIKSCLDDKGIWIIQMSYLPLMLKQNAFDNIMHEHLEYYSLKSLNYLLKKNNMKIIDVTLNNTNSGSFRVIVTHEKNDLKDFNLFDLDLSEFRLQSLKEFEKKYLDNLPKKLDEFQIRVINNKDKTLDFLSKIKKSGYRIFAYGASSKGNTLLQYYGLDENMIEFIAERQKRKEGLFTVKSNIPIVSEKLFRKQKHKSYTLVLPWHFTNEFLKRESNYLNKGNHFIVPLPQLKII